MISSRPLIKPPQQFRVHKNIFCLGVGEWRVQSEKHRVQSEEYRVKSGCVSPAVQLSSSRLPPVLIAFTLEDNNDALYRFSSREHNMYHTEHCIRHWTVSDTVIHICIIQCSTGTGLYKEVYYWNVLHNITLHCNTHCNTHFNTIVYQNFCHTLS